MLLGNIVVPQFMVPHLLTISNNIITYQVSKSIHSSILLVKRGSRESHEIQLLTA